MRCDAQSGCHGVKGSRVEGDMKGPRVKSVRVHRPTVGSTHKVSPVTSCEVEGDVKERACLAEGGPGQLLLLLVSGDDTEDLHGLVQGEREREHVQAQIWGLAGSGPRGGGGGKI